MTDYSNSGLDAEQSRRCMPDCWDDAFGIVTDKPWEHAIGSKATTVCGRRRLDLVRQFFSPAKGRTVVHSNGAVEDATKPGGYQLVHEDTAEQAARSNGEKAENGKA